MRVRFVLDNCHPLCLPTAGMYLNPGQMGYPAAAAAAAGYGQYQAMAAQGGMMGAMIAPQMGMVAQPGVMPQAGMGMGAQAAAAAAAANPYMAGVQGGMMGGVAAVPPQQAYGAQHAQQLQWNLAQVSRKQLSLIELSIYLFDCLSICLSVLLYLWICLYFFSLPLSGLLSLPLFVTFSRLAI